MTRFSGHNITSANSKAVMTIEDLFPTGFNLEQYSADTAISQSEETLSETRMGVDGQMVAGFTPAIKNVTIQLEASSPSKVYLETLVQSMQNNQDVYKVNLTINIPSINKTFYYTGGVLKTGKELPDLKKVLDPVSYTFDFEKITIQ